MLKLKKVLKALRAILNIFGPAKTQNNSSSLMVNEDLPDRTIREDEMVKREKVEGTPFTIVEQQGKTFIAIGMYKVSQDITYREAKEAIEKRDWGLMLNVSRLITLS